MSESLESGVKELGIFVNVLDVLLSMMLSIIMYGLMVRVMLVFGFRVFMESFKDDVAADCNASDVRNIFCLDLFKFIMGVMIFLKMIGNIILIGVFIKSFDRKYGLGL